MPVKKKPTAKQLAARKKFVEMVRAKAKAKKIASTHKDTKSHNVNIRVVSGTIGALPFTGLFMGVKISARTYHEGIKIDVGSYSFNYYKGDNTTVLAEDIASVIKKQQKIFSKIVDSDYKKIISKVKAFILSLKSEFPKGISTKKSKKTTISKPAIKTKQNREYYKDSNINKSIRQTGTSDKLRDKSRVAKDPGKRETEWGSVYYERRANRSDKPGSLLGLHKNLPPVYTPTIKLNQSQINDALHQYERWNVLLNDYKNDLKIEKDPTWKKFYANEIKQITAVCKSLKSHINSLKKVK